METTSADEIVHGLFAPPSPLAGPLSAAFGADVVDEDGGIRRHLLRRAAAAGDGLRRLEAIVHPAARERLLERIARARQEKCQVLAVEVPLLFEAGWDGLCHLTVAVVCDEEHRRRRLGRRGIPRNEADALDRRHLSQEEKAGMADVVIENSGDLTALREKAKAFVEALKRANP